MDIRIFHLRLSRLSLKKRHAFGLCVVLLLFAGTIPSTLHAHSLTLPEVYQALRVTIPLDVRQSIVDSQAKTAIQNAEAPYQLHLSARSQADIDNTNLSTMETSLLASVEILPEADILNLMDAAKARADIQSLEETEAQLLRYKTATTLYFTALTAQEAVRHTERILDIVTKQQAWIKSQVAIGRNKPSSLSSNTLSMRKLQLQKAQYQRQKREALLQLSSLTGISPNTDLQIPSNNLPQAPKESALYQRPDIRKQQLRILALDAEIHALRWTLWPNLDAFGILTPQDSTGKLGLSASWPIFDTKERVLAEELLKAKRSLEAMTLQEIFRAAVGDLWAKHDTLRSLDSEYRLAKTTVMAAETQYQQYKTEYSQNLVTLLDVLQTLNSWHETELDLSHRQIALQEAIALLPITLLGEIPQ